MARFHHLGVDEVLSNRPRVLDWRDRLFDRPANKSAIETWFNPKYLEIFDMHRDAARTKVRSILATAPVA
jgi:hypothetical protein